jgi:hypothetical protein
MTRPGDGASLLEHEITVAVVRGTPLDRPGPTPLRTRGVAIDACLPACLTSESLGYRCLVRRLQQGWLKEIGCLSCLLVLCWTHLLLDLSTCLVSRRALTVLAAAAAAAVVGATTGPSFYSHNQQQRHCILYSQNERLQRLARRLPHDDGGLDARGVGGPRDCLAAKDLADGTKTRRQDKHPGRLHVVLMVSFLQTACHRVCD